jgi:hypothetical protein
MELFISGVQFIVLISIGILYCRATKTFEIQRIPNIIIFFASRTSSVISGLYYWYMAVFTGMLMLFPDLLKHFSAFFFIPYVITTGLYALSWWTNYLFIKKRQPILLLGILNIISIVLALLYLYLLHSNNQEVLPLVSPFAFKPGFEGILLLICIILLVPLILWHFYAPFAMNWKMWLTGKEFNVLSEAFIIFFFTGFPICHLFLNIYYVSFYKIGSHGLYLFFVSLFGIILSVKLYLWLTYKPQTRYFKSFKIKLLPVLLSLIGICFLLIFSTVFYSI